MASFKRPSNPVHRAIRHSQRGVVMVVTLIALLLLLIGVAAMLRGVDSGALIVGNLAFRRDLTNQADQAIVAAKVALVSGPINSDALRQADNVAAHYFASRLPAAAGATNGIPAILVSDSTYDGKYGVTPASALGVKLRFVIDRQCYAPGGYDFTTCEYVNDPVPAGGTAGHALPGANTRPIYRISVRVSGPRNTEAYFQSIYVD